MHTSHTWLLRPDRRERPTLLGRPAPRSPHRAGIRRLVMPLVHGHSRHYPLWVSSTKSMPRFLLTPSSLFRMASMSTDLAFYVARTTVSIPAGGASSASGLEERLWLYHFTVSR